MPWRTDAPHLLRLSVRDGRQESAIDIAAGLDLPHLCETDPLAASDVLARALASRMEELVLFMLARRYPPDVNRPVFAITFDDGNGAPVAGFHCPSILMLAISFELEELVMRLLRVRASA